MDNLVAELKRLPPDTPITSSQLAALLEQLLAQAQQTVLTSSPNFASLPDSHELTQVEVSQWLRKATSTLEKLRLKGTGPAYKPGRPVLYKVGDIKAWLASRKVSSTSEATVRGIRRFESFADLHAVFYFKNELPMGLLDALDHEELNEAIPTSIDLLIFPATFSMKTTLDKQSSELTVESLLTNVYVKLLENSQDASEVILETGKFLVSTGLGINTVVSLGNEGEFSTSLAHLLGAFGHHIDAPQLHTVLHELEEIGIDFDKVNQHGFKPDDLGYEDSYFKQWVAKRREIQQLKTVFTEHSAQGSKAKRDFKL